MKCPPTRMPENLHCLNPHQEPFKGMNDIRFEHPYRSTNDIDSLLMHSECSFLLTSLTRSAFVARFSTYIVFFLFNMSQAKTKYLVHPLLGKPENSLPREIYSAFLVAQVEIDLVCKCLDNIKLTMDDLKKACDESSKETKNVVRVLHTYSSTTIRQYAQ